MITACFWKKLQYRNYTTKNYSANSKYEASEKAYDQTFERQFHSNVWDTNTTSTIVRRQIFQFSISAKCNWIFEFPMASEIFIIMFPPMLSSVGPEMSFIKSFVIGPNPYWLFQMRNVYCSQRIFQIIDSFWNIKRWILTFFCQAFFKRTLKNISLLLNLKNNSNCINFSSNLICISLRNLH